jgi:hypothetical protein
LTIACECGRVKCRECADAGALATLLRQEFAHTERLARVPTPEIVWWRAQMRAREEAARTAARPILLTQAVAFAALVGLLISVAGRLTLPALSWAALVPVPLSPPLVLLAVAVVCWLVIAPLALYFAD